MSFLFPAIFERFSPYHFEPEKFKLQTTPIPEYGLLYPESAIDFNKMAYYFEGTWADADEPLQEYINPIIDSHREWIEHWQRKNLSFYYEKGPGFLTIYDNRPWRGERDLKMRRLNLNEIQSRIYLFCDENRSFNSIRKMLSAEFPSVASKEQTRRLLDQFVEQGLMFREGDRFLSLAVRENSWRNHPGSIRKSRDAADSHPSALSPQPSEAGPSLPVLGQAHKGPAHYS